MVSCSNWIRLRCGVPQGSILGPLLFLIYINDLPSIANKNNNIILYADDTSLILTDNERNYFSCNYHKMFVDLNTWFDNNLLKLNFGKTQYMEFETKIHFSYNMQVQYKLNYITNTSVTKFLGLIIDDALTWNQHILQLTLRLLMSYIYICV